MHSKCKASDTAERGEMAQDAPQGEEVPFGIRAIERGCEVDGVWNSKTNTPLQTTGNSNPGSPLTLPKNLGNMLLSQKKHGREMSMSTVSNPEIPEPALARLDPNSLPGFSADSNSETRPSSEKADTPEYSPCRQLSMRGRRAYQPKISPRNVPYPPSAYPSSNSQRSRSYPPSAYQPPSANLYRSYPSSLSCASTLDAGK